MVVAGCGDNTPGIVVDGPLGSEPLDPAMFAASPGSVDFGTGSITTTVLASLTVTNVGETPSGPLMTSLEGMEAASFATASTTCTTLAPGATCTVSLKFAPLTVGVKSATLTLTASPGGSRMVPLEGTAVSGPGGVTVSPGQNHFGTVPISTTSSARTFTVSNFSATTFGALSVTPAGTNASDYAIVSQTCSGAVLTPGTACTIDVVFTPTVAGGRSASFVFAASPGGSASASVTGIGQ
jgi:hypothetical protein